MRVENTKILHRLETLFAKSSRLLPHCISLFHEDIICDILVIPQMRQSWNTFYKELLYKRPYTASIREMRLSLPELEKVKLEAAQLRKYLPES